MKTALLRIVSAYLEFAFARKRTLKLQIDNRAPQVVDLIHFMNFTLHKTIILFWAMSRFVIILFFFTEEITSAIKQRGCASNPCAHNAQCKDKSNGEFQCICPPAFTGMFCEISVIKHGKETEL